MIQHLRQRPVALFQVGTPSVLWGWVTQVQSAAPPEPARWLAGMFAVLALIVLCAVLMIIVLLAGRRARRLVQRERRHRPSGRVGPSDWEPRPWTARGDSEGPPESDSAEGDTRND